MKTFTCDHCGHSAYFENTICAHCGLQLAFDPAGMRLRVVARETADSTSDPSLHLCANAVHAACNWLAEEGQAFCIACRHNLTIPDLSEEANAHNWRRIEDAKKRLFYSLLRWGLPLPTRLEEPEAGLAFDFVADILHPDGRTEPVMTGHADGLITINIAESDDAERERRRVAMKEPYRTLLGHFRHEVGHFYWDRLVRDTDFIERFRTIFGDERKDYGQELKRHHDEGPLPDWPSSHISAYATAHPWEDFAETFAHYVHMVDTLETAHCVGIRLDDDERGDLSDGFDPYRTRDARRLAAIWVPMTLAVNSMNRSMGQPDLYPFVLTPPVLEKLQFVADLLAGPDEGRPRP